MGGITGIFLAVFPIDWQLTDTYFVVAHFHYTAFGASAFAMLAALYFWFPKITGRMLSESLGKVGFALMFVGFHLTFLIQHSAGLSRHAAAHLRVLRHELDGLQLHLHGRRVHDRAERRGDRVGIVYALKQAARSPGRTRGRRTRSSGSRRRRRRRTTSTSIPRVRSVEPMKDIRREIEQRTERRAALPLRPAVAAVGWKRRTQHSPVPGVKQVVADYFTLTKPKVQLLLLLTTITTMYVAGDPSLALVAITVLGGFLSAGGAGAFNHYYDRDIDAAMGRTATRPGARRADLAARGADLRVRAADRVVRDPRRPPRTC